MRIIAILLNFTFVFHSVAFAETSCSDRMKEIDGIDVHLEKYFEKHNNPYKTFTAQVNLKVELEKVKKFKTKEDIKDLDYSSLALFNEACKEYQIKKAKKEVDEGLLTKCHDELIKYSTTPATQKAFDANIELGLKQKADKVTELQKSEEFQSLKNIKKYNAFKIIDECDLSGEQNSKYSSIACSKEIEDVPVLGLQKHVVDNLEVILKLQAKLNKVDEAHLLTNCSELTGLVLKTEKGAQKFVEDKEGKPVNFGYDVKSIATCNHFFENKKLFVYQKSSTTDKKGKKNKRVEDIDVEKKKVVKKDKDTRKKKTRGNERKYKENYIKPSVATYKRKNNGRAWKIAAGLGATVGAGFLMYYGIKSMSQSTYTAPTKTYTKPRTFNNYSMNPYEQYKMRNYMYGNYSGNNYNMPGYQMSPNWIGYTPDSSNSPYTFEFGN